ncbi:hypothetical protein ACJMK2_029197 [Sinanodonta woodiana]|uniref:Uncharacterized protein n=1 Tax=Sinanodonta woodiana TaxID=1069815 RepID=A0ABD3XDA8_SINWO
MYIPVVSRSSVIMLHIVLAPLLVTMVMGEGCCFPDAWEGVAFMMVGSVKNKTPHLTKGVVMFHMNYTLGMIVIQGEFLVDGLNKKVNILKDYNKKIKYHISDGKCTKNTLETRIPRCLPENTTLVENTYLGSGTEKVAVKMYSSNVGGLEMNFTVTANGCFPIVAILSGIIPNSQVPVMKVYEHSGSTVGIKDPSVFDIPAICQPAVTMDWDPVSVLHNSDTNMPF